MVDLDRNQVVAVEPHKQGDKVSKWSWDNGKVTVASVDGVTDEFDLRIGRGNEVVEGGPGRRYTTTTVEGGGAGGWAPWNGPFGSSFGDQQPQVKRVKKKKPKTIFDLLFN
ncbi:MAG: hypothetical protein J0H65_07605 [Rhizobiales bacterium]|nr:hypothetical protein [Hyphomicrobiales bacterium]